MKKYFFLFFLIAASLAASPQKISLKVNRLYGVDSIQLGGTWYKTMGGGGGGSDPLKLNILDTAAMLGGYVRTQRFLDSLAAHNIRISVNSANIAAKLNIDDTTNKWLPVGTFIPAQFNPIAGTGISITGSYPNQTFNSSGGGSGVVIEQYPHLIASGAGTEASPYTYTDSTAALQTTVDTLTTQARPGGQVKLANGRFDLLKPVTILGPNISKESVSSGFNVDPNGSSQGVTGSTLIASTTGIIMGKNGTSLPRYANIQLRKIYLYGLSTYQSTNSTTGTAGIEIRGLLDQPVFESINIGGGPSNGTTGFDFGIHEVYSGTGNNHDLAYYDKVNILGGRFGVYYDAGFFPYEKWDNSTFADTKEANFFVKDSILNISMSLTNCTFVRGGGDAATINPCNVYFGGYYATFTGCVFTDAGKNRLASTQTPGAYGLILSGKYNTIVGCTFFSNADGGAIKITGSNNFITGCTFYGNQTDIYITGDSNRVDVPVNAIVTDLGNGNVIIRSGFTASTGLTNTNGTVTSNLSTGVSGGQTLVGSTSTNSGIRYKATSGVGTTGANHNFLVGNNGADTAMTILNNKNVGIGTTSPSNLFHTYATSGASQGVLATNIGTGANDNAVIAVSNSTHSANMFTTTAAHATIPLTAGLFTNATNGFTFTTGTNNLFRVVPGLNGTGSIGIGGVALPTSLLNLAAGTTTKAPLSFGVNGAGLSALKACTLEAINTDLYYTDTIGGVLTRRRLAFNSNAAMSATSGSFTPVFQNLSITTITPTGDCSIVAPNNGRSGQMITIEITTSGTTSWNITFSTGFKSQGVLATGVVSGKVFTVTFITTNGSAWSEVGRTVAM